MLLSSLTFCLRKKIIKNRLEQGILFQHLVWKRVAKLAFCWLVQGKGFYSPAAHPHQIFLGVPPGLKVRARTRTAHCRGPRTPPSFIDSHTKKTPWTSVMLLILLCCLIAESSARSNCTEIRLTLCQDQFNENTLPVCPEVLELQACLQACNCVNNREWPGQDARLKYQSLVKIMNSYPDCIPARKGTHTKKPESLYIFMCSWWSWHTYNIVYLLYDIAF